MPRLYATLFFALSVSSASILKAIDLPDPLIYLVMALMLAGAIVSNLTPVRTAGTLLAISGLILLFRSAPEPSLPLTAVLIFLAALQITATGLLISADFTTAKEKQSLEL